MAGILLVVAGIAAALLIAGLSGDDPEGGGGGGGEPSSPPVGTEVELTAAQDFDPVPGDETEHPDEVELAIDGDGSSFWLTEEYRAAPEVATAAGKPGVGLVVGTDEPVTGTNLSIASEDGGWDAEIYAAPSGPPLTLQGWGPPVGEISDADTDQAVELDLPEPARYYMIWLTKLTGTPGEYKVEINEVGLTAS